MTSPCSPNLLYVGRADLDSHLAFTQKVNLHASSMVVGLCPTLVLKADATPAAFIVVPVALCSSYLWLKHFRLRRRYRISTVRTGREMFRNALDEGVAESPAEFAPKRFADPAVGLLYWGHAVGLEHDAKRHPLCPDGRHCRALSVVGVRLGHERAIHGSAAILSSRIPISGPTSHSSGLVASGVRPRSAERRGCRKSPLLRSASSETGINRSRLPGSDATPRRLAERGFAFRPSFDSGDFLYDRR